MLTSVTEGLRRVLRIRQGAQRHALAPLRVLLPAFRFFDTIAQPLALHARLCSADGTFGPWLPLLPEPSSNSRPLRALLLDPAGNLRLARHGLLERLQSDLSELEVDDAVGAERLVSYTLVLNLVRGELGARAVSVPDARVQFRLTSAADADAACGDTDELVLRSAVHRL